MDNSAYSIEIKAPVISARDNINIKDTINLLERQLEEQKLKPEIEIMIPKINNFSELIEETEKTPVVTRVGRTVKRPERYTS